MAKKTNHEKKESNYEEEALKKEKQMKEHDKILRLTLVIIVILIFGVLLFYFFSKSLATFEYKDVKFEVVRFCDAGPPCLITYRTSIPVKTTSGSPVISLPAEKNADYNFFFRNDPRDLEVPFNGTVKFAANMVFNTESEFKCDGYGAIAGANFVQLFTVLGTKVINDKNATCDPERRYVYISVKEGNETKIEEFNPACYNIYVNNCEVLKGTEKYMIEALVGVNKVINAG